MKQFIKDFIISYIVSTIFYIFFFGNMNFFGEQGFHIDLYMLLTILTTWSLFTALILSGIVYVSNLFKKKSK